MKAYVEKFYVRLALAMASLLKLKVSQSQRVGNPQIKAFCPGQNKDKFSHIFANISRSCRSISKMLLSLHLPLSEL